MGPSSWNTPAGWLSLAVILSLLSAPIGPAAQARVKLVALPDRAETVIRLDHPGATLIEEERVLTLQKGANRVAFSWDSARIDPDSIRLKALDSPDSITLLNVSYPPNGNALVWEIHAERAHEERVRISYLLSSLDRLVEYKWIADREETAVTLRSFLVMRNFSGEGFRDARMLPGYGASLTRDIRHGETRKLQFLSREDLPIEKVWTWDAREQPWEPGKQDRAVGIPVSYRLANTEASGLGASALWGGKVRVFQHDGHGGTILLGEDRSALTPVGQAMEVGIGESRDIVVTQHKTRERRINVRRDDDGNVEVYDTDEVIEAEIESFRDEPAVLRMIQQMPGPGWQMVEASHDYERRDFRTLEFTIRLEPGETVDFRMHYRRRNVIE